MHIFVLNRYRKFCRILNIKNSFSYHSEGFNFVRNISKDFVNKETVQL